VVEISETHHPELLYAMRGVALAEVRVATEIRLRLIDEPPLATWRFTPISKKQLMILPAIAILGLSIYNYSSNSMTASLSGTSTDAVPFVTCI
jgi:hypothetical protein